MTQWLRRGWLPLILVIAIAYGSFYPFDYATALAPPDPWLALLREKLVWTSFADVIGNVVLFIPIGLSARLIDGKLRLSVVAALTALIVFYAYAIQVGQYYFAGRDPLLSDVVWNSAGWMSGVAGAYLLRRWQRAMPRVTHNASRAIALTILALWLGSELAPFVPSLDVQRLKDALKPLLHPEDVVVARAFALSCGLATCAELMLIASREDRLWRNLAMLVGATLLGKLLVATHAWHWATFLAIPCGALLTRLTQRMHENNRHLVLALLLLAAFTCNEIFPLQLREEQVAMQWIPFAARLGGNMLTNMDSLFLSLFQYTGILWFLTQQGARLVGVTLALSVWAFAMEWAQTWLADRTPDATEVLLVMFSAALIRQMQRHAAPTTHLQGKGLPATQKP
ncbi:VanZ family protein [Uliginosibacterium sp. H3]|uniref:VanZ family protein n=1 Tax=Uliginosibacterium silvisoli TaxID=3114758 RepID=A0ABU6K001_9RHOO|nr:VanZ family protein [Uliginosibacterium sp. H3]